MMYRQMLEMLGYKINDRRFSAIERIVSASEDYSAFKFVAEKNDGVVYTGAEHKPSNLRNKLPNLTHLPNLETSDGLVVVGCTMGHYQKMPGEKRMQEIYEFHGYGAMVIDNDDMGRVNFVFAKSGDKIAVPNKCHMTIYNLDTPPLNTADYANPDKESDNYNDAHKDMQNQIGAVFCIYFSNGGIFFKLNNKYVNSNYPFSRKYGSGVKLNDYWLDDLEIEFNIDRNENLGERLYAELKTEETIKRFTKIGVNLSPASEEIEIAGIKTKESLMEILARDDKILQKYFGMI